MAEPPLPHFWEGPIVLRNPFVVYVATFAGALAVYQLGWSEILPPLSLEVATFFGVSFAIAALLGKLIQPAVANIGEYRPGLLPSYAGLFVLATIAGEIWLNGIPIVRVMRGENFYEMEAAARHLHVFSLWSVYSTIRFADFLYSRRRLYLLEALVPLIIYGLFIYRGPAIIL